MASSLGQPSSPCLTRVRTPLGRRKRAGGHIGPTH
jgi:hypothetical protein